MKEAIHRLAVFLKEKGLGFLRSFIWYYTVLAVFMKSLIFIGLIYSSDGVSVDLAKAYQKIPSLPVYLCFVIAVLAFAFLLKRRLHTAFLIIANSLVTLLILVDLWNFRAFEGFATMHSLKQTGNLYNLGDSIISMMNLVDLIFIADLLVLGMFLIFNKRIGRAIRSQDRNIPAFAVVLLLSVGFISFMHYKVDVVEKKKKQILFHICWTPRQTMSNLSPIGYHIYDAYVYWKDCQPIKLSSQQKEEIENWFEAKKENLPDNKYKGIFKGKNLIFFEAESLESFVVNRKINNQEITPVLNRLLDNSLYFTNFYDQTFTGTSSDAMLISNTSVYPVRRGTTFFRYPHNTHNSMPELMEKLGYKTLAAEPDKGSYWNWMEALTSFGFDKCIDSSNFNIDEQIGMGLSDGSFLRQLAPVAAKMQQPFYLFLVTQTTHTPYALPYKYREISMVESINKTRLGGYLQSIRYTDKHMGIFLDNLDKAGILEDTVVVIYGDHEGVHKFYPGEISKAQPGESWWQENNRRLPLLVYSKGFKGEVIDTIGGQVDILPTIAYLMGVDEKEYVDTAMGRNLLKTEKSFAVLSNGNCVGEFENPREKENAIKGLSIADNIIRSNYFKNR